MLLCCCYVVVLVLLCSCCAAVLLLLCSCCVAVVVQLLSGCNPPVFQIFRRGLDRLSDLSWDALKKEVTLAVEAEVVYSKQRFPAVIPEC